MYLLHAIEHKKWMIALVCMTLLGLALSVPYETYRTQQLRHELHHVMMQIALQEHEYYLNHYTYTDDLSVLNKARKNLISDNFPYRIFLEKNMDYHHDFVIIAQYKDQKSIQQDGVLCPYLTLNQAGRWCVTGHCAAQCWTE